MKSHDEVDLISVVVPIYGVEEFLEQCVDTILNQTYLNTEIILVDDGSPDRCGQICDEYKSRDKRISVIHKKNGGLSDARNCGMKIATGKYITFVDSDDYMSLDFIEHMHNLAVENSAEIAIVGFIKTTSRLSTERIEKETIEVFDKRQALREMLYSKKFSTSAWGKLYLRSFFDDVKYPYGKFSEDMFTTYKVFDKANRIVFGNQICYYYLRRPGSILVSNFSDKHFDVVEGLEQLGRDIPIKEYGLQNAYASQMLECIFAMLERKPDPKKINELGLWARIKKYRFTVLKDSCASKRVRCYALLSYLGLRPAITVINNYYNLKWRK